MKPSLGFSWTRPLTSDSLTSDPPLSHRYLPTTDADRRSMLEALGLANVSDLFRDIPAEHRYPELNLPPALTELELKREMAAMASRNANVEDFASFLGAGAYHHFIPSVVWNLAGRSEMATAYTPYQPEISQGILQASYEFQTLVCQLTGMEVANTGMYDGATALAEAALMACRITKRESVAALDSIPPAWLDVLRTYAEPQGISVVVVSDDAELPAEAACLLVQSPNFYGYVEDLDRYSEAARQSNALLVVATDPIHLGLFRPPGEYGADIVVGEGQPLGLPISYGGTYLGLFACKAAHLRQMPGRIAGKTVDVDGRTGYVLTLQTREQHIRRERATSNICTSETLAAVAATIYLAVMGKSGLREVAEHCYHKAHYAAERIAELPGYHLPMNGTFFKEFVVECPLPPAQIIAALAERRIIGGLDISDRVPNGMLLCVTEMNPREEIDRLVATLGAVRG